jgi:hypothetical protein
MGKELMAIFFALAGGLVFGPAIANFFALNSPQYQLLEAENQRLQRTAQDYEVYRDAVRDLR